MIADNYYRPIDKDKLLDEGLGAGVKSLDDRFSAYFDPKEYKEFQEATDGAFEGVGMNVAEVERGLRVLTVFDGSPAAARRPAPRRRDHRGRRQVARGQDVRAGDGADQGAGGHGGDAHAWSPASARRATSRSSARASTCPSSKAEMQQYGRREDRARAARRLHLGRARRGPQGGRRAARQGRARASCSTCATTAAACSTRRC